jgi:hypothetical protein
LGKDVEILDASSGMGYGTADLRERGFNIEDVEPYQSAERKANNPATYSSYADIAKKYDFIISNAVLNVIPDNWRANVLHDMAARLKVGGQMFINTRKAGEEKSIKDKIELDSPQEVLVKRNGKIASYQRFFTPQELKAWVEQELANTFYYHFFPVATATPEAEGYPELMFQLSTVDTDNAVSSTYIYTKNFKKGAEVITAFEEGKIYRMNFTASVESDKGDGDVPVNEDDIDQLGRCLDITVTVDDWNVILVTPEF